MNFPCRGCRVLLLTVLAILCLLRPSPASVVINIGLGTMYSSTNTATPFPVGGLIELLALTNGSTWSNASGLVTQFQNQTGSFVPAGAVQVGRIGNDNSGGSGVTGGVFSFTYNGFFTPGEQLLAVAYPTLTTNSTAPGIGTPGFFFRTNAIIDGSDIAWLTPADGANVTLAAYTIGVGGSLPNAQFTAGAGAAGGYGFTTVPEPSSSALMVLGGGLLVLSLLRSRTNRAREESL